jgi:hypothetical protein
MKAAKVFAFYFGDRRFYPTNKSGVIELFKRQIESHKKIHPGVPTDLIIVNHDTGDLEVREFLDGYENFEILGGKIRILHRPRINGDFSIGSYKYAFHLLKDEYDYWFFCEDDIETVSENVIRDMIDMLESDPVVGFIAALNFKKYGIHPYVEKDGYIESTGTHPPHAHGGVGLTSTSLMLKATNGTSYFDTPNINLYNSITNSTPHHNISGYENENSHEVGFSNIFHSAGLRLKAFSDGGNFLHIREGMLI